MRLCFGSYLSVLVSCKAVNVDNKVLCEALLHSVAPEYEFVFSGQENPDRVREDNSSKLRRCEQNLPKEVTTPARDANPQIVANYFKEKILPLLNDNQYHQIILALKDIIANDPPVTEGKRVFGITDDTAVDIVNGTTKGNFASQSKFSVSAFLAGVFLFVATKTNNRSGKKTVRFINDEYILSFAERVGEIELIDEKDAKKASVIEAAKQGITDVEFSEDDASLVAEKLKKLTQSSKSDRDLLITLLTEARGKCLKCGAELGIPVRRKKPTSNCEVVYVKMEANEADIYDNAVAVCATPCSAEVELMDNEEKKILLEDKRRCADVQAFLGRISNVVRSRKEIEAVLRELHAVKNDPKLPESRLSELKEIQQKIHEPHLVAEVNASMVRMYKTVKNICGRLDDEDALNSKVLGDLMKAAQSVLSDEAAKNPNITDPQEYVTELLVDKLYAQVGQKHRDACKMIVGFLIKRCDLFNETAKQS